jgi:hypothetical protein
MNSRAWKVLLLPVVIAAAAAPAAGGLARERPPPSVEPDPFKDFPATHNMMLVGENTAFLSHLPMFVALDSPRTAYATPHRYQVILEVTFTRAGRDVTQRYLDDRKRHPREKMYTIHPNEEFILPGVFAPGAQQRVDHFRATVFRGHFERRGDPIPGLEGVVVNVRSVVHAAMFDPAVQHPERLTYILFGRGAELFLAHSITRPPDFDQILSVRVDGHAFTDGELARGVEVTFSNLADTPLQRIKQGQSATGEFHVAGAHQVLNLPIRAGTEFYFEEGELQMPHTFDDTNEEIRAGFTSPPARP